EVLKNIAAAPTAVLLAPVLLNSVPAPTPVLKKLLVLFQSETHPSAVLNAPVPLLKRARNPSTVLPLPRSPSLDCACALGKNVKQASAKPMRSGRIVVR